MAVDAIANSSPTIPSTTIDRTANPAPTTTTSDSASAAKDATLNYDSFLKLLVAQMKNQDPTDPVDASEQMSQLASFSNVEQAIKTNKNLESLIRETSMSQAGDLKSGDKLVINAPEKLRDGDAVRVASGAK